MRGRAYFFARSASMASYISWYALYQIPESVTLGASQIMASLIRMWRTKEVRHVGSDTIAPGFWGTAASGLGEEDKGWAAGS